MLCVIRYAMQLTDGDELDLNAADMNNNGRAEIGDALVILRSAIFSCYPWLFAQLLRLQLCSPG